MNKTKLNLNDFDLKISHQRNSIMYAMHIIFYVYKTWYLDYNCTIAFSTKLGQFENKPKNKILEWIVHGTLILITRFVKL